MLPVAEQDAALQFVRPGADGVGGGNALAITQQRPKRGTRELSFSFVKESRRLSGEDSLQEKEGSIPALSIVAQKNMIRIISRK